MLYQNFGRFNFSKALLLGGVCTAILTGCNQPAQDASGTDAAANGDTATEMKTVAITAIVEHPALDDVRKGVIDELNEAGFKDGENLTVNFQSAQGNTATAGQIAKQLINSEYQNSIKMDGFSRSIDQLTVRSSNETFLTRLKY